MIPRKSMKVSPISNDLIQDVNLRLNKDGNLEDEYFTNMSILSTQNYDIDDLKKHAMERFFDVSCVYLNTNIVIMEDGTNNDNRYLIEYLNN